MMLAGGTASLDFPATDGALDTSTPADCILCPFDATVTQIGFDGTSVQWSRIFGGPGYDRVASIVSDDTATYVGGSTGGGLVTTAGAGDRTFAGGLTAGRGVEDGFVCRLDSATGAIVWCSYVGGTSGSGVSAVAARGDVYAAFTTAAGEDLQLDSDYAPAFAAGQRGTPRGADIVVIQLAAADGHFVAATYAGGTGDEHGPASLVHDGGYIHLLAGTTSSDVPVPNGFTTTAPTGANLFLTTYAPGLSAIQYGTYVGGSGDDFTTGNGLAGWNDIGEVVAIGVTTYSDDMPYRNGVHRRPVPANAPGCGAGDVWFATVAPTMAGHASLLFASYLGGADADQLGGIGAVDGTSGRVLALTGSTSSRDFPVQRGVRTTWLGPNCTQTADATEASAALVNTTAVPAQHAATFLGGTGQDRGNAIDFVYVAGETSSLDLDTSGEQAPGSPPNGFLIELGPYATPPGGEVPMDATLNDDIGFPEPDAGPSPEPESGCCGTAPAPVAPGTAGLAGLVMLLVRRRRGR